MYIEDEKLKQQICKKTFEDISFMILLYGNSEDALTALSKYISIQIKVNNGDDKND